MSELESSALTDDVETYAKVRNRTLKNQKQKHREYLEIDKDYDDYWAYRKHYRDDLPVLTRLQYLDFHTYLPDQILTKVDRASMAVSLEARVPLLATELAQFVFSVPESIRYSGGQLKGLLKIAYKDHLPDYIIRKKKQGFSIPLHQWRTNLLGTEIAREDWILKDWYGIGRA